MADAIARLSTRQPLKLQHVHLHTTYYTSTCFTCVVQYSIVALLHINLIHSDTYGTLRAPCKPCYPMLMSASSILLLDGEPMVMRFVPSGMPRWCCRLCNVQRTSVVLMEDHLRSTTHLAHYKEAHLAGRVKVTCNPCTLLSESIRSLPRYLQRAAYEVKAERSQMHWVAQASHSLVHLGFCILRGPRKNSALVPEALSYRCRTLALARLERLLLFAESCSIEKETEMLKSREVCQRGRSTRRYDMAVSNGSTYADHAGDAIPWEELELSSWEALHAAVDTWARPVAQAALLLRGGSQKLSVETPSAGCVTSFPGTPDQYLHRDGDAAGLINVFIPLVDTTEANGPTELLPATHTPLRSGSLTAPNETGDIGTCLPELKAGQILMFDYRCLHRGRGNRTTQPRPVAYVVYAQSGIADKHNFPLDSLSSKKQEETPGASANASQRG